MVVFERTVSFVVRTVEAPLALPSAPGQVNVIATAVASQACPPAADRFCAETEYTTVDPFATDGSAGFRSMRMVKSFWSHVGGSRCSGRMTAFGAAEAGACATNRTAHPRTATNLEARAE